MDFPGWGAFLEPLKMDFPGWEAFLGPVQAKPGRPEITKNRFFRGFWKVFRIDWDVRFGLHGDVLASIRPRNRAVRAPAGAGRDW